MLLFCWITGTLLAAVWLSRTIDAALGLPRVAVITGPAWDAVRSPAPTDAPAVAVAIIVPARNEEESIEACLRSLLALEYPAFRVIAIDDRSTDSTGAIMDRLAAESASRRLQVIHVSELPEGWLGKTHAMWIGAEAAAAAETANAGAETAQATAASSRANPKDDWLLFTDGDVIFRPDTLNRAVAYAAREAADHLVLYPTIIMKTFGERMMIGFFQIMFVFGHRSWKVADPKSRDHVGVGAFNMVRRGAYQQIGTYRALRFEVVDDLQLGRRIKQHGLRQRNVLGPGLISLRWAKGALGIARNLNKNFFALFRYRSSIALGAAFAALVLNLGPFLGVWLAPGWSKLGFAVSLLSIFALYVGGKKISQVSPLYFFAHPLATVLVVFTILRSTCSVLWQGGVVWRGTKYPLAELRKNLG